MTEGEEHARLSWKLIEWKVAYYRPDSVHFSRRQTSKSLTMTTTQRRSDTSRCAASSV
jgi:hypothetical protein